MDYSIFVKAVLKQDDRNAIEKTIRSVTGLPDQLAEFYSQYEPDDAEIVLNDLSAVVLYPYNHLFELQNEYELGDLFFVFATKNSDPIAIFNQQVVILAHGTHNPEPEVIAMSFNDFVEQLMANMKVN